MKLLHNTAAALCCSLLLTATPVLAVEYALPAANSRLVGENLEYVVPAEEAGQPLEAVAAKFQLGLTNMLEANPKADPLLLQAGEKLVVPINAVFNRSAFKNLMNQVVQILHCRLAFSRTCAKKSASTIRMIMVVLHMFFCTHMS